MGLVFAVTIQRITKEKDYMNLQSLRAKGVYVDIDDISIILPRPDVIGMKEKNVDSSDQSLYDRANAIIEDASSKGKYFNVSGRDEVVRSLIVLKSGIVIGINNTPDTLAKRLLAGTKGQKQGQTVKKAGRPRQKL